MLKTDTLAGGPAFGGEPGAPASMDGIDWASRCAAWQDALPRAEIVFPAPVLAISAAAKWVRTKVRDREAFVGVRNEQELALAIAACIPPARVVFHSDNAVTRTIWHAVGLGVGRFVVSTERQLLTISACAPQPQCVLVDIATGPVGGLLAAVVAEERLDLTGLHCQLDNTSQVDDILAAIGQLAQFVGDHAVAPSSLSLAVPESVNGSQDNLDIARALVTAVADAVARRCQELGLPRPVLMVAPDAAY